MAGASKRNAGGIGDARVDTRGDATIIMGAEGGAERVGDAGGGYAGWIVDDVGTKGNTRHIADVGGDASRWDARCIADGLADVRRDTGCIADAWGIAAGIGGAYRNDAGLDAAETGCLRDRVFAR